MPNELTDEEITILAKQHLRAFAEFVGAGEVTFEGEHAFARAVLAAAHPVPVVQPRGPLGLTPFKALDYITDEEALEAYVQERIVIAGAVPVVQDERAAFLEWRKSLTTEQKYDFDSEGRGIRKDREDYAFLAWKAGRAALGASTEPSGCAECGRLASEGWALYCLRCAETGKPDVDPATRADEAPTTPTPVAWVPYCFADSETAIEGQFAWDEIAEKPFEVRDTEHWMCLPLYAPSLRSAAGPTKQDQPESGIASGADARDAARYRWLRRFDHFAAVDAMLDTTQYNTLDAAVDAAMGAVKGDSHAN